MNLFKQDMKDILCTIMGTMDIIAGILILIAFGINILSIIFGIGMIIKGGISLVG